MALAVKPLLPTASARRELIVVAALVESCWEAIVWTRTVKKSGFGRNVQGPTRLIILLNIGDFRARWRSALRYGEGIGFVPSAIFGTISGIAHGDANISVSARCRIRCQFRVGARGVLPAR